MLPQEVSLSQLDGAAHFFLGMPMRTIYLSGRKGGRLPGRCKSKRDLLLLPAPLCNIILYPIACSRLTVASQMRRMLTERKEWCWVTCLQESWWK